MNDKYSMTSSEIMATCPGQRRDRKVPGVMMVCADLRQNRKVSGAITAAAGTPKGLG